MLGLVLLALRLALPLVVAPLLAARLSRAFGTRVEVGDVSVQPLDAVVTLRNVTGKVETPNFDESAGGALPPRPPPEFAGSYVRPRYHAWADLLRRTFELDILACRDCGRRLRLLATIAQREVIDRVLAHLRLPTDPVVPAPAQHEEELFA